MWLIGLELIERFPVGLGPDNARYMARIDPAIPPDHRHMHNNLLNIAVESGWIGLVCYLWWMYVAVWLGFYIWRRACSCDSKSKRRSQLGILGLTIGASLLGWQVAGLVEYNFGDGEVVLIALFYMGLLLGLSTQLESENPLNKNRISVKN